MTFECICRVNPSASISRRRISGVPANAPVTVAGRFQFCWLVVNDSRHSGSAQLAVSVCSSLKILYASTSSSRVLFPSASSCGSSTLRLRRLLAERLASR